MKRIAKISVIMLLILAISPLAAFAAPQGYMEVELNKKNFKQYFEIKKVKLRDAFGAYDGYSIRLSSKMLKQGYYIYDIKNFAIKGTYMERYKYKYKKKTYKSSWKTKITTTYTPLCYLASGDESYNYRYAKVWNLKIKNVKGTVIFAEPSNIIGIDVKYGSSNNNSISDYKIRLRYPYDESTSSEGHYDESINKWVKDYYYCYPSISSICGNQILG